MPYCTESTPKCDVNVDVYPGQGWGISIAKEAKSLLGVSNSSHLTRTGCRDRLLELKAAGVRVPQSVFDRFYREILHWETPFIAPKGPSRKASKPVQKPRPRSASPSPKFQAGRTGGPRGK